MISWNLARPGKTFLIGILVLASSIIRPSFAQQDSAEIAQDFIEMGLDVFDFAHRKQSRELFTNAIMYDQNNAFAHFMVGQSIILTVHREESLPYFLIAYELDPKVNDSILFMIGRAYHYAEEFTKAIGYYELHKQKLARSLDFRKAQNINRIDRKIFECRNGMIFKAHPVNVKITNLSDKVNSEFPEYAPAIRADEKVLMFTSRREDNVNPNLADDHAFYEDVYVSYLEDGQWQQAVNIGDPISTLYHNASIGLSPDGKELFLYSDENGGDIMVSFMDDQGKWSVPTPIRGEVNTEYLESSATITKDRQTLYFTSNRLGGYGGTDIWSSKLSPRGRWKAPVNLGPIVNTELDEDGAFISADGHHLYFSSYGHYGMGDLDIYQSELDQQNQWGEPINLGYPINSVEDDIYFVLSGDEKNAYFSSVKFDSWGEQDIYKVNMEHYQPIDIRNLPEIKSIEDQPLGKIELAVIDRQTQQPLEAEIKFTTDQGIVINPISSDKGKYDFELTDAGNTTYHLEIAFDQLATKQDPELFPVDTSPAISGATGSELANPTSAPISPAADIKSRTIVMVYHAFNSPRPKSYENLDYISILLSERPELKLEIRSHTDNFGDPEYNRILSETRAAKVRDYIVKKGIDKSRIETMGWGDSQPVATNDSKDGRRLNRRTEVSILDPTH